MTQESMHSGIEQSRVTQLQRKRQSVGTEEFTEWVLRLMNQKVRVIVRATRVEQGVETKLQNGGRRQHRRGHDTCRLCSGALDSTHRSYCKYCKSEMAQEQTERLRFEANPMRRKMEVDGMRADIQALAVATKRVAPELTKQVTAITKDLTDKLWAIVLLAKQEKSNG